MSAHSWKSVSGFPLQNRIEWQIDSFNAYGYQSVCNFEHYIFVVENKNVGGKHVRGFNVFVKHYYKFRFTEIMSPYWHKLLIYTLANLCQHGYILILTHKKIENINDSFRV